MKDEIIRAVAMTTPHREHEIAVVADMLEPYGITSESQLRKVAGMASELNARVIQVASWIASILEPVLPNGAGEKKEAADA